MVVFHFQYPSPSGGVCNVIVLAKNEDIAIKKLQKVIQQHGLPEYEKWQRLDVDYDYSEFDVYYLDASEVKTVVS